MVRHGTELLEREAGISRGHGTLRPRDAAAYCDWSLLAELTVTDATQSRLERNRRRPAGTVCDSNRAGSAVAFVGYRAEAVVGHSMGEVAAACVAGALSLEDAARIICQRSRLIRPTIGHGAMAAVELSLEDAQRALAGYEDRVSVAASNSPISTVLSGDPAALETILDRLRGRDIFCAMVKVDFASHSPQMEPLRADLLRALEGLEPRPVTIPIYSTVTGSARRRDGIQAAPLG